jgi:hypothetical protein
MLNTIFLSNGVNGASYKGLRKKAEKRKKERKQDKAFERRVLFSERQILSACEIPTRTNKKFANFLRGSPPSGANFAKGGSGGRIFLKGASGGEISPQGGD